MYAKTLFPSAAFALALAVCSPLSAQLFDFNDAGVAPGHMHLNVADPAAEKKFYTEMLDGKIVKNGPLEMIAFPGVFVIANQKDDAEPTGAVLDHFGFVVKDMPGHIKRWQDAGYHVDITANPNEAYVISPSGLKVEVYGVPDLDNTVQFDHIHFWNVPDIPGMQAWYDKMFGMKSGQRLCVACLPREVPVEIVHMDPANISFTPGQEKVAGSKGHTIDHLGFEVKDIEKTVAHLKANGVKMDSEIREIPAANLKIAFLTDPWGTYIELTEGLEPK